MNDITKWRIYFSMVFGGIFVLTTTVSFILDFIPDQVSYGTLTIWIGGLAVSYILETIDNPTTKIMNGDGK